MKKILILLLGLFTILLSGCSAFNEQVFDTNFKFDKAHLVSKDECIEIKKWKNFDDGDMVQIVLEDDTAILGHSNEIVLIKGNCPYCED